MKRYVIQFAPEWCIGCLSYDTYAASEEAALATIDRLLKEGIKSCDVTAVDVWEDDDPAWDIVQGVTEMGSYR
tara:strand:- start:41 stop:259 length:219 start_codon:yes stop_codon:yes gene_type:complete